MAHICAYINHGVWSATSTKLDQLSLDQVLKSTTSLLRTALFKDYLICMLTVPKLNLTTPTPQFRVQFLPFPTYSTMMSGALAIILKMHIIILGFHAQLFKFGLDEN